ncbi:MAG: hypothetical protein O3C15_08895, partial [Proteobacteria bacterium]|nr:hypothetical protein [Pseudomonadota bacterium]
STPFRALAPEASVSTNFTTWAGTAKTGTRGYGLDIYLSIVEPYTSPMLADLCHPLPPLADS